MGYALVIAQGKGRGRAFRFAAGASIGRGACNDLVLNEPGVSRVHASIVPRGAGWAVRDRGSANGTELNGRKVAGAAELREGDLIGLGPAMLEFHRAAPRRLVSGWRALRAPQRAVLVASCVLPVTIAVECAASLGRHAPAVEIAAAPTAVSSRPPVADLEGARAARERGRRKLLERRVAPRNLYDAWAAFREARALLAGAEPVEAAAVSRSIDACERDLRRDCQRLLFSADRFEHYGQPEKAQQAFREMLLHFPGDDPGGCHRKAQENLISAQPDDGAG